MPFAIRYNLFDELGSEGFVRLCNALLVSVISPRVIPFLARGADGGRDATYQGHSGYAEGWKGNWVFQYKFIPVSDQGIKQARERIRTELLSSLDDVTSRGSLAVDNFVFLTNVTLTAVRDSGFHDWFNSSVLPCFRTGTLKNIDYWDGGKVLSLLDKHGLTRQFFPGIDGGQLREHIAAISSALGLGDSAQPVASERTAARSRYFSYLAEESGFLEVPTIAQNGRLSFLKVPLESLYISLQLQAIDSPRIQPNWDESRRRLQILLARKQAKGASIGRTLKGLLRTEGLVRMAVLGPPGSGKTTLLSRLAIAYAFPERRAGRGDGLPARPWLPWILRCRDVDGRSFSNVFDTLVEQARRWGFGEEEPLFSRWAKAVLREEPILLLVDGLDELRGEQRLTFAAQLRNFLALHPKVSCVLTSREAGYKEAEGPLAGVLQRHALLPLKAYQVDQLLKAAAEVSHPISNERLLAGILEPGKQLPEAARDLATNPHLLMTLLVVAGAIGDAPMTRALLYDKTIEALLARRGGPSLLLRQERLCLSGLMYLGWRMMVLGVDWIYGSDFVRTVREATGPDFDAEAFLREAEERAGLLRLVDYALHRGSLQPRYRFPHRGFLEFLAAKAFAEPLASLRVSGDLDLAWGHFAKSEWREVVLLAAELLAPDATPLLGVLCSGIEAKDPSQADYGVDLLLACLNRGVQPERELLERVIAILAASFRSALLVKEIAKLPEAPVKERLHTRAWTALSGAEDGLDELLQLWRCTAPHAESGDAHRPAVARRIELITEHLASPTLERRILGLALLTEERFIEKNDRDCDLWRSALAAWSDSAIAAARHGPPLATHLGVRALAFVGSLDTIPKAELVDTLLEVHRRTSVRQTAELVESALAELAASSTEGRAMSASPARREQILELVGSESRRRRWAGIVALYHHPGIVPDAEILRLIENELTSVQADFRAEFEAMRSLVRLRRLLGGAPSDKIAPH